MAAMELRPVPRRGTRRLGRVWLLGAALVLGVVALLQILPAALGLQRYVVTTDAMGDTLPRGSLVVARTVVTGDLRVGDIITFPSPEDGQLVTRRVTGVFNDRVITGGDTSGPDPWSLSRDSATRDRMLFHVPLVGYPFIGELGQWVWLVAAVPIAAVLLAVLGDFEHRRRQADELADSSAADAQVVYQGVGQ